MSFLLESEEEGVTILTKIEHFDTEFACRYLHNCIAEFSFPMPNGMSTHWTLDYNLTNYNSESFYSYLTRRKDMKAGYPIEVSGTFSVITSDGVAQLIGVFFDRDFATNTVCEIKLKKLDSLLLENEDLFPNDSLTLRCHLWSSAYSLRSSVEYHFLCRTLLQKCSFLFVINGDIDEHQRVYFNTHKMDVPMDFSAGGLKKFQLKVCLIFQSFHESEAKCIITITKKQHDFYPFICHSFGILCKGSDGVVFSENKHSLCEGTDNVVFSENKHYFHLVNHIKEYKTCMGMDEFKQKQDLYYPSSLTLICNVKCVIPSHTLVEKIVQIVNEKIILCSGKESVKSKTEIVIPPIEEDRNLNDSMYSLYQEGKLCDVTLKAGEVKYSVHKSVLCARSTVFSAMFESNMKEKESSIVDIEDVDPRILSLCLVYMYKDKVVFSDWEDIVKLFVVADRYAISSLKKKCVCILKSKLSTKNVCNILVLAFMHDHPDLKKMAVSYICKHAKEIINYSEEWQQLKSNYSSLALEILDLLVGKVLL